VKLYRSVTEAEDAYVNAVILYEHGFGVEVRNLRGNEFEQRRVTPLQYASEIGLSFWERSDIQHFVARMFVRKFGRAYPDNHQGNIGITEDGYPVILDTDSVMNDTVKTEREKIFERGINVYCKQVLCLNRKG
jgi:hypothetical protein